MDTNTRAQARLILDHESDLARNAFDSRLKAICAEHAAKGLLKSGATIKVALRAMEELASRLITDLVDKVAAVSKEPEAFTMIAEAVQTYLSFLYDKAEPIGELAGGKRDSIGLRDSILKATDDRFREARLRLERQLEIHRFTFTERASRTKDERAASPKRSESADQPLAKNRGGRPPAEFWDDMWAEIAILIHLGDLNPRVQADIERAMTAWIEAAGHTAAPSTIRTRARKLWHRLQTRE